MYSCKKLVPPHGLLYITTQNVGKAAFRPDRGWAVLVGAEDNMANGASSVAQQGSDAVAGVGSAVNSAANGAADAAASGTEKVAWRSIKRDSSL